MENAVLELLISWGIGLGTLQLLDSIFTLIGCRFFLVIPRLYYILKDSPLVTPHNYNGMPCIILALCLLEASIPQASRFI